uniref:Uncharacterized protein n=1 Tax=Anopheles dirus TaxID=7168 RepID=A0A182NXG3_9DIPT
MVVEDCGFHRLAHTTTVLEVFLRFCQHREDVHVLLVRWSFSFGTVHHDTHLTAVNGLRCATTIAITAFGHQLLNDFSDAVALGVVVEPEATNARTLVAVQQERWLRLQLNLAADRFYQRIRVEPIVDEDAVVRFREPTVDEQCALDVCLLPLVFLVVKHVQCDVCGRVDDVLRVWIDPLDRDQVHPQLRLIGHLVGRIGN